MRFNPPPNWPPAPPGWVPDSSWVPDPAWPPPPPGWQLWVDDSAPQHPPQFTPGYSPQFPPQPYSSQWQPSKPPGSTSPKPLWIALAAVAAVALVVVVAIFASGGGGGATSADGDKASGKPDITELTEDLLVGKSAFPDFDGGRFNSTKIDIAKEKSTLPDFSVSPRECGEFFTLNPDSATQAEGAGVQKSNSGTFRSMKIRLSITKNRPNLKEFADKCHSFTLNFEISGSLLKIKTTLKPLEVSGVPSWAVANVATQSVVPGAAQLSSTLTAEILGYYRGILVSANYDISGASSGIGTSIDSKAKSDLVGLFNAQVEKLEAVP